MGDEKIVTVIPNTHTNKGGKDLSSHGDGLLITSPPKPLAEKMYRGYVKVWRKTKDWYARSNPLRFSLWVNLLLEANHKSTRMLFKGKPITVNAGQLVTGRKYLSQITGISESYVEILLKEFEGEGMIIQQKSNKSRLITIVNHERYQGEAPREYTTDYTTERQQKDNRKTHKRMLKNDKHEKEDIYTPSYKQIIEDLNKVCGTAYRSGIAKTNILIGARLKEGFTIEDFKRVHRKKHAEWGGDEQFKKYLRPETLYGTKFESYLNQPEKGDDPLSKWRIKE